MRRLLSTAAVIGVLLSQAAWNSNAVGLFGRLRQDDQQASTTGQDDGAQDAAAQQEPPTFDQERRLVARKMNSGLVADRIEGLLMLKPYKSLDAARVAMRGLEDENLEVRQTAHGVLVGMADSKPVCAGLLGILRTESRRAGWNPVSYSYLFTLAMSPDEEVQTELITVIDTHAAARANSVLVLNGVIDGLGEQADAAALGALRTLAKSKLIADDFGMRRGLVQAIIAIREPEALDALLEVLPHIDGEVRGDAIKYLSALSGERYGTNADAWKRWWDDSREGFEFPNSLETPQDIMEAFTAEGTPTYYDLPIYAKRLVFIIDSSASMSEENRMNFAKQELVDAIEALGEDTYFDIVAFNSTVGVWQRTLQQATTPAKVAAANWVNRLQPVNYTASYDALEATFGFKNLEAIYFVSDGAPTVGKIVEKDQIVQAVREGNRTRRVTLYTIGIQPDKDRNNSFERFLKALAEENYGRYRPVGNFAREDK